MFSFSSSYTNFTASFAKMTVGSITFTALVDLRTRGISVQPAMMASAP